MKKFLKIVGIVIGVILVIYLLSFTLSFGNGHPETGLSFSELYAKEDFGLDWKAAYEAILTDLNPQHLILMAYWTYLEPQEGKFDFSDLDWQLDLATQQGKDVILAVGQRVPRWPECHIPTWASSMDQNSYNQALLSYLTVVINHYKPYPAIKAWQVENEPYLSIFGNCPPLDKTLFDEEIALVKKLDPTRPVMTTDSGELGLWYSAAKHADILGTTLYRVVSAPTIGVFHYFFIPPVFYTLKAEFVKKFTDVSQVIISELQAEPWSLNGASSLVSESMSAQTSDFSTSTLLSNFKFAERTGLSPIYLWGSEWWYWRKIHGDSSFWNLGKQLLNQ
ncbi:MAG: beta-galactosidase [Patescibacteria group bacterium]|nr:beta-galactosidase [Patescibacteria group bacterium]